MGFIPEGFEKFPQSDEPRIVAGRAQGLEFYWVRAVPGNDDASLFFLEGDHGRRAISFGRPMDVEEGDECWMIYVDVDPGNNEADLKMFEMVISPADPERAEQLMAELLAAGRTARIGDIHLDEEEEDIEDGYVACPQCRGEGYVADDDDGLMTDCPECLGYGIVCIVCGEPPREVLQSGETVGGCEHHPPDA